MRAGALMLALHLAFVVFAPAAVLAESPSVRWSDVRGIVVPASLVGSGTGAVTGGGVPWSTSGGSSSVNLNTGLVKFSVRGLVLAGGNSIGTRGGVTQVKGTLVCDTNGSAGGGNSALVDTDLVNLDEQGNARFQGNLGPLPAQCSEPDLAFLVRTAGGAWLAYGAVRRP
jgi:hypothetical protein